MQSMRGTLLMILAAVSATAGASPQDWSTPPPTKNAEPYEVISVSERGPPGRKHIRSLILAPSAKTIVQRAETALLAAKEYVLSDDARTVQVIMDPDRSLVDDRVHLAVANYAPCGGGFSGNDPNQMYCGTWEVLVTDYQPTATAIKVTKFWFDNEYRFMRPDGSGGVLPDDDRLAKYVAEHFHMTDKELDANLIFEHVWHDYYKPPECVHK